VAEVRAGEIDDADFDYAVVGGGSAGCVLAGRLSAAGHRVLLVEAGPDMPAGREPDDIRDADPMRAYANPRYKWNDLRVRLRGVPGEAPSRYEQARVLGGGSSINAQVANRGAPADYDALAAAGAAGWAWDDVLPYFRALEHDLDFDGPIHGRGGPLPVTRLFPPCWSAFVQAVGGALADRGLAYIADLNDGFADGYGPVPTTAILGRRMSTAMGYLGATARQRANLAVLCDARARTIRFDGRRAVGVVIDTAAGRRTVVARETVLACGALHTPAMLMRSGIGPGRHLADLGIAIVAASGGVGANLRCHGFVSLAAYLPRHARLNAPNDRFNQLAARFSSGLAGCPPADMYLSVSARSGWHAVGRRLGALQVWPNASYSQGCVRLASPDAETPPQVALNLASDARDLERLKIAFRFVAGLFATDPVQRAARDPFAASYSDRAKRVGQPTLLNRAKTRPVAALLDGPGALRRLAIRTVVMRGPTLAQLLADDALLEDHIRRTVGGTGHVCGTARMGRADDPAAVTDPAGRVRGVFGLSVGDASLMPDLPRANTNVPTVMIAEKIAAGLISQAAHVPLRVAHGALGA
jgi:5-(hydroxymethyl)furfural/furfural oxidase